MFWVDCRYAKDYCRQFKVYTPHQACGLAADVYADV